MTGKLLDTNIIIALFADDVSVKEHLAKAEHVFIPAIALGELYFGVHRSTETDANCVRLNDFASSSAVLVCGITTARHYGRIKNGLLKKGRPIPENDIWIAAIAMQYGLTAVTRDLHFDAIDGITIERW
ncbi:MAG: type II toxin-antitoxin system VapC family toxin [Euryarchaeota archaeon]|nr:MAG: tRNA(fMet)-specific endonuclease VapC [ANME-2 cluster archaeon]MEA1865722.1 type II toxin-antitoxin system VapC family toxin [Euryarchaeota archaeon]